MKDEKQNRLIAEELKRVLRHHTFQAAPQVAAFLRYVVDQACAGRASEIKAYTIAVDALDRRDDFDPQADSSVRAAARRVRDALAIYYAGDGAENPVRIAMPKGGYVPTFTFHTEPKTTAAPPVPHKTQALAIQFRWALAAVVLVSVLGFLICPIRCALMG